MGIWNQKRTKARAGQIFEQMALDKTLYKNRFMQELEEGTIVPSRHSFKISLFMKKAENSLLIAKHHKEMQPSNDEPSKLYWDYWAITISYYAMLYSAKAAILSKGYEVKTHEAAHIALGHLLVPSVLDKEDLEILNQSHKIFEDEYVKYFEDARKESHIARYAAIKTYTSRQVEEIFSNASAFIAKISLLL